MQLEVNNRPLVHSYELIIFLNSSTFPLQIINTTLFDWSYMGHYKQFNILQLHANTFQEIVKELYSGRKSITIQYIFSCIFPFYQKHFWFLKVINLVHVPFYPYDV
jgi:hypothetical protein